MTDPGSPPPEWDLDAHLRRYRACWSAFAIAATSAGLMAIDSAGWLVVILTGQPALARALRGPAWQWTGATAIAWGFPLAALVLARLWDVPTWRRRAGQLVFFGLGGVGLWALRHAHEIGLSEVEVGHQLARDHAAILIRWAVLGLLAGLAADVLDHLGVPGALDARHRIWTLLGLGVAVGGFLLLLQADWSQPWPLQFRRLRRDEWALMMLLSLALIALRGLVALSLTILCLGTGRACAQMLRELQSQSAEDDLFSPFIRSKSAGPDNSPWNP